MIFLKRIPLNAHFAERARDTLAKTLYVNLHEWIIERINKSIKPANLEDSNGYHIGILDMPGFGKIALS